MHPSISLTQRIETLHLKTPKAPSRAWYAPISAIKAVYYRNFSIVEPIKIYLILSINAHGAFCTALITDFADGSVSSDGKRAWLFAPLGLSQSIAD